VLIRVHPWLIIFSALTAAHGAQLSIPSATAAPGTSILLPVSFASQSASATGIQFDLQYDNSALSLSATAGDATRMSGKTLSLWDLAPGKRRFLIAGLNWNPLVDGTLINLFVNLSPTAASGTYSVKLLNVVGTDSSAQAVTVKAIGGGVTVQGSIILFASGAGQTDPGGADGQIAGDTLPKPLKPVSVQIGDLEAKVLYAGAAPGMVAGVLQVNCLVPLDSPSGYAVSITLSVGNTSSPAGVTLAVR
jgi:Cohesin domain